MLFKVSYKVQETPSIFRHSIHVFMTCFCASLYLHSALNTWSSCACALRKLFKRWEKVIENRRWQLPDYSVFEIISSLRVKMNSIYHESDAFLKDLHREQIMLDQDAKDISNKVLEVSYISSSQMRFSQDKLELSFQYLRQELIPRFCQVDPLFQLLYQVSLLVYYTLFEIW